VTSSAVAVSDDGIVALKSDAFFTSIVGSRRARGRATAVGNWLQTGALGGGFNSEYLSNL
jgi:hypothetical protein